MRRSDDMTEIPVISVVTPSFNQGAFLEETLLSVLSQEGTFYLDYLVIDGGSDDDSPQIIQAFAERVEKGEWQGNCEGTQFRWISEQDRGQADALAKGFQLAEGAILAWLNSDDVYLPGTLQVIADFFRDNPEVALLYGDAHYCDATGGLLGRYPTENFDLAKLAWFNFICQPATFFRKEAFEAVGGLDDTLHYAMDYDLFVRIGRRFNCRYLPRCFATYRLHLEAKTMRHVILLANHEEALHVALKYFRWAPINRVYGSCSEYCLTRLPGFLTRFPLLVVVAALCYTLPRSLWLNRGLRRQDLRLIRVDNFRKMFRNRMEILRG